MSVQDPRSFVGLIRFGSFEVDLHSGELRKHGIRVRLQEQSFQVLQVLLERPGEVLSRAELQKKIWPADTFVDFDHGLNNVIKRLRESLGDSAESPRYIETLARKGYRFIGTLEEIASPEEVKPEAEPAAEAKVEPPAGKRKLGISLAFAGGVAAIIVVILGLNLGELRDRLSGRAIHVPIQSLAVLPLTTLSGDAAQEYFADGLTDALIGDLSQISALKVISRTSSMQYKQTKKSLPEIARELGVDGVIEGTVQRSGDRVRVTAQLIQGATDKHISANSYERNLQDALTLQGDIAQTIAQEIRVKLTPQERVRLAHAQTINLRAMEAYLQGQYHLQTAKDMRFHRGIEKKHEAEQKLAIEFFQKAVAEDPN